MKVFSSSCKIFSLNGLFLNFKISVYCSKRKTRTVNHFLYHIHVRYNINEFHDNKIWHDKVAKWGKNILSSHPIKHVSCRLFSYRKVVKSGVIIWIRLCPFFISAIRSWWCVYWCTYVPSRASFPISVPTRNG